MFLLGLSPELNRLISWMMEPIPSNRYTGVHHDGGVNGDDDDMEDDDDDDDDGGE